ncbi:MAG: DNA primase [Syntrophomonadaceae bacterium]|nr:DNA primase [Syntrophomonadaceae bacterium]MDD3022526.1 DNA primase [Syntrophomonadaceae bacterium]
MTAYYDDQLLIDIQSRLDIVDIVSETVKLNRKGNRYWGLCPFHEEKTESFSVTPEKNMFYCFGCHAGGDMFSFVMKREGTDFKETIEMLAAKAGIEIVRSVSKKEIDHRKKIIEVNQAAAEFYHKIIIGNYGKLGNDYLMKRGITADTISKYQLGWAPEKWNNLEEYLLQKGFSQENLKLSGLIKRSDKQQRFYDLFRKRIIFPIYQYNGDVIGFGGRVLDDSMPKYLNTPETEIFSKRNSLYGLYQAREAIRQRNEAIIVEGYMDCLKLHQADIKHTVASLGTAFTREQAVLLRRYAEKVLIIYDSDEAGQRETLRAIDILAKEGLNVSVAVLPGAKDPDEYLDMCGKEEFLHYIQNNKLSNIEYKIIRYLEEQKVLNMEVKIKTINLVKDDIGELNSELEKDYYVKYLAKKLMIEENLIKRELKNQNKYKTGIKRNNSKITRDNIKYGNYSVQDKILAYMLGNREIFNRIKNTIGLNFFANKDYRTLANSYDELQDSESNCLPKLRLLAAEKGLGPALARIMFLIEDDIQIDTIELEEFIRRIRMLKRKSQWQSIYADLSRIETEGNFNALLRFILNLDQFLNHTREGGKR